MSENNTSSGCAGCPSAQAAPASTGGCPGASGCPSARGAGGKGVPDFSEKLHEKSSVKHVIGVVSGKGGVGKSFVTASLAARMASLGHRTAVLDGDITGPSIPKSFGLAAGVTTTEEGLMIPAVTATGIQVMSANLLLANETDPVIWRGPVIAGTVKQFWKETLWSNIDYMFVDMPPGTGDVPLTVFQSLPVDGIIVVTSPQELVTMIVAKAVNMADKMHVPVLGLIENMSYFICPNCEERHSVFGESHIDAVAAGHGLSVLAKIPMDPAHSLAADSGTVEYLETPWLDGAVERICRLS